MGPKTSVTSEDALTLLSAPMGAKYRQILELIVTLVQKSRLDKIMPGIDHGRMIIFCEFWGELPVPKWMVKVIKGLQKGLD